MPRLSYLHASLLVSSLVVLSLLFTGLLPRTARGQSPITGDEVNCADGSADRYPCENVDLLSYLPLNELGGGAGVEANDVWGWTDPQTGTEYALVGRTDGTAFVDVSTPTEPVYLGSLPSHTGSSTWRDVKVHANHAYVVSEAAGHGLQVFDLTQLRDISDAERPVMFSETAHYDRMGAAHNVVINAKTEFAYVVGANGNGTTCGGGLHMVDLQAPTAPAFAGCFADPSTGRAGTGYTHDAQCVVYQGPDSDYDGREVCFNANETALNIADVENKSAPATIANATYPQIGYTHQAWLTEDHRYLYVDDELDERQGTADSTRTLVFDITNLDSPELVTSHAGRTGAIDHNQYIVGDYAYQANYQSGLRILDVSAPERPTEVAFFDTFPNGNASSFQGAWSTYPFFERNMVLVSSIREGLFVVQPSFQPILSVTGTPRDQGALIRWTVSGDAETAEMELQHKPPAATAWQSVQTFDAQGDSGVQDYEFAFVELVPGTHQVRVRHTATDSSVFTSRARTLRIRPREAYRADGPFPNPAREQARFELILRETQRLRVALYDTMGRRVRLLHNGPVQAGATKHFRLRTSERASGTYFLQVWGESVQLTRKLVVTR